MDKQISEGQGFGVIRRSLAALALAALLAPAPAGAQETGQNLLSAYFAALANNDLKRVDALLTDDFQYSYREGDVAMSLTKAEELTGLRKLLAEADIQLKQYERVQNSSNRFHVRFDAYFRESSKDLSSFFFASALAFDQVIAVTIRGQRISKLAETGKKKVNDLAFGQLKAIYSEPTRSESCENGSETIFRLLNNDGKLLLLKNVKNKGSYMETTFYLPGNRRITNVLY